MVELSAKNVQRFRWLCIKHSIGYDAHCCPLCKLEQENDDLNALLDTAEAQVRYLLQKLVEKDK